MITLVVMVMMMMVLVVVMVMMVMVLVVMMVMTDMQRGAGELGRANWCYNIQIFDTKRSYLFRKKFNCKTQY